MNFSPTVNFRYKFSKRTRLQLTYRTRQLELTGLVGLLYNNSYNDVREKRTETFDYQVGTRLQLYLPWDPTL